MRISTNQLYDVGISNMLAQQEKAMELYGRTNGVRVQTAADDPVATAQIQLLSQRISRTELLQQNCQNAVSALSLEETTLNDIVKTLQDLRDLQVKAGDPALSQLDRKSLAVEAQSLLNQLHNFANTRDINDQYMFSGGQASTQTITLNAAGQYVYNGDAALNYQVVSESLQLATNDTGDNLFMRYLNGNGTFAISNPATPNGGTASLSSGFVTNSAAYVADNYTMSFALNSSGNLVLMVSGATSGTVIPPSGLPDDAPLYQDGMTVNFNGMEMTVSGIPLPGDTFSINPAQSQSIFSTVQQMIETLQLPFDSSVDKAVTVTENNQLLAGIDQAMTNILNYQADVGTRLNQLDFANDLNTNLLTISRDSLKQVRELDPIVAVSEYNQQLVNLQVAEQCFARIQGLSIFNYL